MIIVYKNLIPYNFNNTQCIVYCTILSSTDVSHFSVAKATLHSQMSVCLFVCQSAKPLNSLKSSSFIILHTSFLHFATFKLFSLFKGCVDRIIVKLGSCSFLFKSLNSNPACKIFFSP